MQPDDYGTNDAGHPSSGWPAPAGAVEVLPADAQRTDRAAWMAARLAGIGGSDLGPLLGLVSWESRYGLWLTKTGRRPDVVPTGIMERGTYLEPALCQWFADKSGLSLRRTGTWARLETDDRGELVPGWARCNPDRLTSDGGVVEVKAPNHADWGDLWRGGPAEHAVVQLLWCLIVLDLPHGYVVADGPAGLRHWRIDRAPLVDVERWVLDRAATFYFRHVVEDEPPPVDGSGATKEALSHASAPPEQLAKRVEVPGCAEWARYRRDLKNTIAEAAGELARVENQFRAALVDAITATDGGAPVLSWEWTCLNSTSKKPYRQFEEPK